MNGAKGNALEWALALLHAPGERYALRQKTLPAGMDRLLGVAAGMLPEDLAAAAHTFNQPEPVIREAAQFYAREVLFFPQASAYRVLGVEADADAEQIKAHHRLLQHWLHPDRLRSQDDAVFAARVNAAWNQLRSPQRRRTYDQAWQQDVPADSSGNEGALRGALVWGPEDASPPHGAWRSRLPVLALFACCVLLAVLILRDAGPGPDAWADSVGGKHADAVEDLLMIAVTHREGVPAAEPRMRKSVGNAAAMATQLAPQASTAPAIPGFQRIHVADTGLPALPVAGLAMEAQASVPPARAADVSLAIATPGAGVNTMSLAPPNEAVPRNESALPADMPEAPTPVNAPVADAADAPSYTHIRQAWVTGEQLLHYMTTPDGPSSPIWNSPAIQSSADGLRQELLGAGQARFSAAKWRIGNHSAVLTSNYAMPGETAETGRLTADLVWRESRWLVTGLSMERLQ